MSSTTRTSTNNNDGGTSMIGRGIVLRYFHECFADHVPNRCLYGGCAFPDHMNNPFVKRKSFWCPNLNCCALHICVYNRSPPHVYRPVIRFNDPNIPQSVHCGNCNHIFFSTPISVALRDRVSRTPMFLCPNCLFDHNYFRSLPTSSDPASIARYPYYSQPIMIPEVIRASSSRRARDLLKTTTVVDDAAKSQSNQPSSCSICLEDFVIKSETDSTVTPSVINKLPCGHCFHKDCIVQWFHRKNTCPLCRYKCPPPQKRRFKRTARRQQEQGVRGVDIRWMRGALEAIASSGMREHGRGGDPASYFHYLHHLSRTNSTTTYHEWLRSRTSSSTSTNTTTTTTGRGEGDFVDADGDIIMMD